MKKYQDTLSSFIKFYSPDEDWIPLKELSKFYSNTKLKKWKWRHKLTDNTKVRRVFLLKRTWKQKISEVSANDGVLIKDSDDGNFGYIMYIRENSEK